MVTLTVPFGRIRKMYRFERRLWTYSNGNNQQWQAVSEGSGYFHFVSRFSSKCLTVPGGSTVKGRPSRPRSSFR